MPLKISATKARASFSELLNRVLYRGEEFVVEKQGKPVALITDVKFAKKRKLKMEVGTAFLQKVSRYGLKDAPRDLAARHDKYTWE